MRKSHDAKALHHGMLIWVWFCFVVVYVEKEEKNATG
jgi:hypothetical protein